MDRTEVRGDNYYYPKGNKRGPDIGTTVNGVEDTANNAVIQYKRSLGATTANHSDARNVETPLDKRYEVKLTSGDARLAAANNAVLAPCVFVYNGGIHGKGAACG